MIIPDSIVKQVPKSPLDRVEFYNAEEMFQRLSYVRQGKIPFIKQDMATLSNAVELYYKGLIKASGVPMLDSLKKTHLLTHLSEYIEAHIMPLSAPLTREEKKERLQFLIALQNMYTSTRYDFVQVTQEEFNKCYDWAQKQRNLIRDRLLPPMQSQESDFPDMDDYDID